MEDVPEGTLAKKKKKNPHVKEAVRGIPWHFSSTKDSQTPMQIWKGI